MLSPSARPILTAALLCTFAFLVAVPPLQSQMDAASVQKKAESGDAYSQMLLGIWYANGMHVAKDNALAMKWWTKAAEQGNREAQEILGARYLDGDGVAQDYALARVWFQKAADQGRSTAQDYLGKIYLNGYGVPRDYALARAWYQKAANQGNPAAYLHLGDMYAHGLGVPQDDALAKANYQKAAELYTPVNSAYEKDDWDRLKALKNAQQPSCDPNWSPKFSQITFGGFDNSPASVRQLTDQQVAKYGGVDQSIKQVESEKSSYEEQLVQQQNDGNADGINQVQQLILFSDGMLDILRCRQQIAAQANSSVASGSPSSGPLPAPSGSAQGTVNPVVPAQVDVRYMQVDSRPLTDAEMTEVRNSLRWEPDSVPLSSGGAGRSNLVDGKGRRLGSVLVRWEKPNVAKTAHPSRQNRGYFTLQVENGTSCVFLSSAEIDDGQGFIVVSGVTWSGWLTLHQPDRGQTSQTRGDAALPQAYPTLVLKPLTAYSTLSACMTPKDPATAKATGGAASASAAQYEQDLPSPPVEQSAAARGSSLGDRSATALSAKGRPGQKVPPIAQKAKRRDSSANSLVGTWTGNDSSSSGTYVFAADGSMSLSAYRNSDGATFVLKGHWDLNGDSLTTVIEGHQTERSTIRFLDGGHVEVTHPGGPSLMLERAGKS